MGLRLPWPSKRPGILKNRFLLRALFITIFGIVCFAQCYSILRSFLSYPRIINIYDESPSLISILPGLTICNNNRLSLKKLIGRNQTMQRLFDEKFPGWLQSNGQIKPLVNKIKFNEFRDELARIFEEHRYHHHRQTKNITIDQWFDLRPDNEPFIEWLGCAHTWSDSIDCGNLTRIDSMHGRRCTTLLHRGAMLYDAFNRPQLFNTTNQDGDSLNYFDAKEVIKIVLNFEPEDYGDLKRQIGARLSFHDSNNIASQGDLDYFVTRGFRYDFSIDRRDTKFSNGPHDRCLEYDALNLNKYKYRVEPRVPLGTASCFQNCVIRNILASSDCWPPPMPYYRNDSLDPELSVKHCPWFKRSHHSSLFYELIRVDEVRARQRRNKAAAAAAVKSAPINGSNSYEDTNDSGGGGWPVSQPPTHVSSSSEPNLYADVMVPKLKKNEKPIVYAHHSKRQVRDKMRKFRKTLRFCWTQCPFPCRLSTYTVTVTKSAWPTDVKILFDPTGKERLRRHCCALIAIKFTHYHYNIHEHRPKYDAANTVGDLGGLLAFWLGLSIVSIYHALHKLLAFFGRRSSLNRVHYLRSGSAKLTTSNSSKSSLSTSS